MRTARSLATGNALLAALLCVVMMATGCTPLARERTLPPSIRSVNVPMMVNRTAEPGLEELITTEFQKEILADGRLNLVEEKQADAVVRVQLDDFDGVSSSLDRDDFATSKLYKLNASMTIEENIPGRPQIGGSRPVRSVMGANVDPRTTTFDPEPRNMELLARTVARNLLVELITGDYTDAEKIEKKAENRSPVRPPALNVGH
ncbi:hypothetical protein BH09SUM1_BH09SUM1_21470 [soil metagenome]